MPPFPQSTRRSRRSTRGRGRCATDVRMRSSRPRAICPCLTSSNSGPAAFSSLQQSTIPMPARVRISADNIDLWSADPMSSVQLATDTSQCPRVAVVDAEGLVIATVCFSSTTITLTPHSQQPRHCERLGPPRVPLRPFTRRGVAPGLHAACNERI